MTDGPDEVTRDDTAYTKLKTEVKRGTDTRDQDKTKVVTRHPDPEEAAERHRKALNALGRSAHYARQIQPEESE